MAKVACRLLFHACGAHVRRPRTAERSQAHQRWRQSAHQLLEGACLLQVRPATRKPVMPGCPMCSPGQGSLLEGYAEGGVECSGSSTLQMLC